MVDATISTALDINDVANPSKFKLLKCLCPQRAGRLHALSGVINGSKRVDIPAHKEAAVGLGALDEARVRQVGYYVPGGDAVDQLAPTGRSLEALYGFVASKSAAPSKDTGRGNLFLLGNLAPSASEALLTARRPGVLRPAIFCLGTGSMNSASNIVDR